MIAKALAEFSMRGLFQSALLIVGFTLLAFIFPPAGLVGGGIVALVALRSGGVSGSYAVLVSSVALAVLLATIGPGPLVGFVAGAVQWIPVLLLALVLRATRSWSVTIQAGLVVSLLGVLLLKLIYPDIVALWRDLLEQYLKPALSQAGSSENELGGILDMLSSQMTGLLLASMLMSSLFALMLGRYIQAAAYNPGGFGEEFRELRAGVWPAVLGVSLILFSLVSGKKGLFDELLLVLGVVFFLQGLAVVFSLIRKTEFSKNWSAPFSILAVVVIVLVLVVLLGPVITIVSGLGVADAFANFRTRIAAPKP